MADQIPVETAATPTAPPGPTPEPASDLGWGPGADVPFSRVPPRERPHVDRGEQAHYEFIRERIAGQPGVSCVAPRGTLESPHPPGTLMSDHIVSAPPARPQPPSPNGLPTTYSDHTLSSDVFFSDRAEPGRRWEAQEEVNRQMRARQEEHRQRIDVDRLPPRRRGDSPLSRQSAVLRWLCKQSERVRLTKLVAARGGSVQSTAEAKEVIRALEQRGLVAVERTPGRGSPDGTWWLQPTEQGRVAQAGAA